MSIVSSSLSSSAIDAGTSMLPTGWQCLTLAEVLGEGVFCDGDWVESKDQDPDGDVRLIQLADIGDGEYRDRSSRFLTSDKARQLRCTFLERGDVLVARMPDPLGRACLFPGDRKATVTVVDVCILRAVDDRFNPRWLMHSINTPAFRRAIDGLQSGTTRKRISRTNLASLSLVVPPREEQDRLLQLLEARLSRLDKAVADLRSVEAKLLRHRASVLAAATSGTLVPTEGELARREGRDYEPASVLLDRILTERRARWEADQLATFRAKGKVPRDDKWKAKYQPPVAPDTTDLPELPEGWVWASVDQIGDVSGGLTKNPNRDMLPLRRPFLRVANVYANELRLDDVHETGIADSEVERATLKAGDLLVVEGNGSPDQIGRVALWDGSIPNAVHQNHLIKVRSSTAQLMDWAVVFLSSPLGRDLIQRVASTTSGLYTLSISKVAILPLPVPPVSELGRVLDAARQHDDCATVIRGNVAKNVLRARALRAAILQAAFQPPQATSSHPRS